jgi:NAD(P)-dependent dehydrogenase (short-subunit alcohol dehydrogenase family)
MTSLAMLITGASGSIGGEISRQAAQTGWTVAAHGRSKAKVDTLVAELRAISAAPHSAHVADFRDPDAPAALIAQVGGEHRRLRAVVDCAVGGPGGVTGPFRGTDPAAFAGMAASSVVAFQRLAHASLPWLSESGGTLVAFVSDAGVFTAPNQTLIGAMRAATIGFVRNLAVEVAREGVRVHAISPGFVDETAIARRLGGASAGRLEKARARAGLGLPTPADIAPLVLFLCGAGAARMTGQVISVNGGANA